jgi:putative peptidoglycan lipid II flippase
MAALSVFGLSFGLPAFALVTVVLPAFYSRQDTRTPVKAALVAVAGNALFTVALMAALLWGTDAGRAALAAAGGHPIAALGQVRGAHACLALAIGLAGWLNALQLWWYLRRARVYAPQPGWPRFLRQLAVASVGMAVVVLALLAVWQDWTTWAWWERFVRLLAMVGAGAAAYAGLLWLQGIRPRDLRH